MFRILEILSFHPCNTHLYLYNLLQDLAIHTRVTPEQRKLTMLKFINAVNNKEEARNELERWGLELDSSTIQVRKSYY